MLRSGMRPAEPLQKNPCAKRIQKFNFPRGECRRGAVRIEGELQGLKGFGPQAAAEGCIDGGGFGRHLPTVGKTAPASSRAS